MMAQMEDDDEEDSKGEMGPTTKLFVWGNNDKRQLGISLDQTEESNTDNDATSGGGTGPNSSTTVS